MVVLQQRFNRFEVSNSSGECNVAAVALAQLGPSCFAPKVWVKEAPLEIQGVL